MERVSRTGKAWVWAAGLTLALSVPGWAGEQRFVQDRFAIGLWVDPPLNKDADARYAGIAQANFSFLIGNFGASTAGDVSRQLALSKHHGLKAIVSMAGLPPKKLPDTGACWGYFLADEPMPVAFPGSGSV